MASVYSTWLIYAAGIEFLLASMILYSRGIPLFFYRRREDKRPLIEGKAGLAYMLAMVAAAAYACYALDTKAIVCKASRVSFNKKKHRGGAAALSRPPCIALICKTYVL